MSQLGNWFKTLFKSLPDPTGNAREKDALWERGEHAAAKYLRNQGYRRITRNHRCDAGEVDISAGDGKTLVFVEVKTRTYDDPTPDEQVNNRNQHQLAKAAKVYLSRY